MKIIRETGISSVLPADQIGYMQHQAFEAWVTEAAGQMRLALHRLVQQMRETPAVGMYRIEIRVTAFRDSPETEPMLPGAAAPR